MHRFLKTAVGAALVLLLFAALFCGTVSANPIVIDSPEKYSQTFSGDSLAAGTYYIKGDWEIPSLHNGGEFIETTDKRGSVSSILNPTNSLKITGDVVLDFTEFDGTFAGYSGSEILVGALFGNVNLDMYTLEIRNFNMNTVSVTSANEKGKAGGIIGYCVNSKDETTMENLGSLKFTNCHLQNCLINGNFVAGFVSLALCKVVDASDCGLLNCDVISNSTSCNGGLGGLVGESYSANFDKCIVENSTISCVSSNGKVGGLIGFGNGYVSIIECCVKKTTIYSANSVGGLIGSGGGDVSIEKSTVMNCVITTLSSSPSSGDESAGGLSGHVNSVAKINDCIVTGCTISNLGGITAAGGLIGWAGQTPDTTSANNKVENCAVSGDGSKMWDGTEYTDLVCGTTTGRAIPCTTDNGNFIKSKTTYTDIISLKNAKDERITTPGTDFWKVISSTTAKHVGDEDTVAVRITDIGEYGKVGGYGYGSVLLPVKYSYTVIADPENGGTVSSSGKKAAGKTVSITAVPADGYAFLEWTSSGVDITNPKSATEASFTMPESNVTVTAAFTLIKEATVTPVDYVYGTAPTTDPTLTPAIEGAKFYYSESANAHNPEKTWKSLKEEPTTLNAGTYYVYAKVGDAESKRGTFAVTKATQAAPQFTVDDSNADVKVTITSYDAKKDYEYTLKEAASTQTTENWVLVSGSPFTLTGLKADTEYKINLRLAESRNYLTSSPTEETFKTPGYFTVKYNANGGVGTIDSQTAKKGTTVPAKSGNGFTREGYNFAGWKNSDGTNVAVGAPISDGTTLYAQWTAKPYTITFNANGGSGNMASQTLYYGADEAKPLTANSFTKTDYSFAGWAVTQEGAEKSAVIYTDKQNVQNLGDTTLYAVWVKNVYTVGVTIDGTTEPVTVKLMRGNTQVSPELTEGPYSFAGVPTGTYNIVASSGGKTVTKIVVLSASTTVSLTFPEEDVNSKLEVSEKQNTPSVVVAGLNDEAVSRVDPGKTVTVTMTVEAKVEAEVGTELPPEKKRIEEKVQEGLSAIRFKAGSEKKLQFLDVVVTKTVSESGSTPQNETLDKTNTLIMILLPFDITEDKLDITVYRYHDNEAKPLEELGEKLSDSELLNLENDGKFYVDEIANLIYVYSNKFSQYAVGFTPKAPQPIPPEKPSHSSSRDYGSSIWLPATVEPTPTPTEEQPGQTLPTVSPVKTPTPAPASPAPFVGLLAGLGAASVFFGLRRR